MYQMIAVDDEYLVRTGIAETIDWGKYNIEIAGMATNGKEGLELAERVRPDLILSDVKMPVMDGIAFVRALKERTVDAAVVILSGYKDFEFAKNALENGAYSYLLKPIDNDELVRTCVVALEKLEQQRAASRYYRTLEGELPTIRNKTVRDLTLGNFDSAGEIAEKLALCRLPAFSGGGGVVYGQIDNAEDLAPERAQEALQTLARYLEEALSPLAPCAAELYPDSFVALTECRDAEKIAACCREAVARYDAEKRESASVGISNPFSSPAEIKGAFHTAKNAARRKLFQAVSSVTLPTGGGSYHQNVQEAMDYIARHYGENITIKIVADALYVSESHLMHLFKENVGKTFNECLTDYRMMIAVKLLADGKFKVYEIAESVGYGDVKYFGQVFKRQMGCTPSEYVQKELKRE